MTMKELVAWVAMIVQAMIAVWVFWELPGGLGPEVTAADVAIRVLWGVGAMVVLTVVATVIAAIGVSIAQQEEISDDRTDERDRSIAARSARNAHLATSLGLIGTVIALAMGLAPPLAVYMLFAAMLAGGTADSVSQLVYYRVG